MSASVHTICEQSVMCPALLGQFDPALCMHLQPAHRSWRPTAALSRACAAQILIIMTLLVRILSVLPAMSGLAVTILLIPATTLLARKQAAIRKVCLQTSSRP